MRARGVARTTSRIRSVRSTTEYANNKARQTPMLSSRRVRGVVLRLVRRRTLSAAVGLLLALPALWVELIARDVPWWGDGLSLIAGATGAALLWTAITGVRPDWIDG